MHMTNDQAFAALERLITVAAQEQFSAGIIQQSQDAVNHLRRQITNLTESLQAEKEGRQRAIALAAKAQHEQAHGVQ